MGRIGGLGAGEVMAASQCLTSSILQRCSKIGRNKNSLRGNVVQPATFDRLKK
jgi:hypothetical protein